MLNETFYLDGVDAKSMGIQLQAPIEFSKAVPVIEAQTIPGRNGDLIWGTGSYENRSGHASCFCLQTDVEKAVSAAGRFLMEKKGYRRLETSDDPDHYWMARVENSPQIAMRLRTLAPFDIGFDCKPQRFLKSGEDFISFENNNVSYFIYNPYGQEALPLIVVYGESGRISIGDFDVDLLESNGIMYLDCDTQNAYNDLGNQNMKISAHVFPKLWPGENKVLFSGNIERVEIMPRWWEL